MVRVDLRTQVLEIPTQDIISLDNVSMKVDAILCFNVVDAERAIIKVQDFLPATKMWLRPHCAPCWASAALDDMLSERRKPSSDVQAIVDVQTELGIKVTNVEL